MQVKLWNLNIDPATGEKYDFTQEIKGVKYSIPAGKYILLEEDEAEEVCGAFSSPVIVNGVHQRRGFKVLKIEKPIDDEGNFKEPKHVCHVCGFQSETEDGLKAHMQISHSEEFATQKVARHTAKKPGGSSVGVQTSV